ncbi:methyltransferase [Salmonella enterica subsp. enterica serovar 4,[5],12:i:-]|uniref:Methyltransferase n=15 Tax=Salmonella enterica TaxID=28901 RepID=A0A3T9LM51_SALET|nr:methyltransferase [Salmonella enterica subsp. enterica serovar Newport str. CVM N1543]AJB03663.1 methyltransferase [Salmonella enterica subsp. enterica serovar Newport str. CVM 22425]AJB07841.1 methyltransferase [Salmonella enterica subsp. enterica serovar Newport str. CVM 22462]AJB13637.1 methyltransferase [Salmonella enterica subsp. enterica serovar Newport str. CVM 22513]AJB18595.1 methyltransferase [Salmonella enterica subsp. enterica serovar Newport str. CVM 21538]AJB22857.1 methyltran
MTNAATILDMCCGSRMFWFDKQDERAVFTDNAVPPPFAEALVRANLPELCVSREAA